MLPSKGSANLLRNASADDLWRIFAAAIAGDRLRPLVRLADRDGHFRRDVALDPHRRPARPAAVRLFDDDGFARVFTLDLDAKTPDARLRVAEDTVTITGLLDQAQVPHFVDQSPVGGRHVYVPLPVPTDREELQAIARRVKLLCPSLDLSPYNTTAHGCLRPPGAAHKTGGHQTLLTDASEALDALARPASQQAWATFVQLLPEMPTAAPLPDVLLLGSRPAAPLAEKYQAIAVTGRHAYATNSEARLAIITHAITRGWSAALLHDHLSNGQWPAFTKFYARYGRTASKAFERDFTKAYARVAASPSASFVSKSLTSAPLSHGGTQPVTDETPRGSALWDYLRRWAATTLEADRRGRWSARERPSVLAVLAALGDAARRTGSTYVAFGTRHLSYGAGLVDRSTAAAVLRKLREEPNPLIELIENERGIEADLYLLRIPHEFADLPPADHTALTAVPLAFGDLGLSAWLIWRAARDGHNTNLDALARASGLSRATVYRHLGRLVDAGLLRPSLDAIDDPETLRETAETTGAAAHADKLIDEWRVERNAYRVMHGLEPRRYASRTRPTTRARTGRPPTRPARRGPERATRHTSPRSPHRADSAERDALDLLTRVFGAEILVPAVPAPG